MSGVIDEIFAVFADQGEQQYLGEPVSMAEHMLQSALAAEQDDAPPQLVAAALLHDYGHLVHGGPEDAAEQGIDLHHEEVAHAFFVEHFGETVAEPVRMHVAAKRYLCAVEPAYLNQLSEASLLSLRLQGGPMTPSEIEAFEASPHAQDAVRLRRYDDIGKVPGLETPPLEHYRPVLQLALSARAPQPR